MGYSEEQVKLIVKYAMGYQKAYDYQTAGGILIKDGDINKDDCIRLLDELSNDEIVYDHVDWSDALES